MFWTTVAHAMGQAPAQGTEGPGAFLSIFPFVVIFAIFYFLLIRPQQKRAKEHQAMLASLQVGDQIITNGGLYGRITEINNETAVIDLGDSKVTIGRAFIAAAPALQALAAKQKKEPTKKDGK